MNANLLISICRKLPNNFLGKKLSLLIRRPVKYGPNTEMETEVWGLKLSLKPRGNAAESNLLFTPQSYQVPEREYIRRFMERRDHFVFYDVGANIGAYSYWVLAQKNSDTSVAMIEASPYLAERIQANLDANGLTQAQVYNVGVSDGSGHLKFLPDARNLGESRLVDAETFTGDPSALIEVPVVGLSQIIAERGDAAIDLMKLDIEGMEARVLGDLFENVEPAVWPRALIVEFKNDAEHRGLQDKLLHHGYVQKFDFGLNQVFERAV